MQEKLGNQVMENPNTLEAPVGVAMRRPTIHCVRAMPILPESLIIRRARVEDAGALARLLGRAFEGEHWDTLGTELELFDDESVKAVLVVAADSQLVATASLQVRPDTPECGQVRWVATEFERRRQGLARMLVISALALAEQAGCREALLLTENDRLAAISLYLQLGFEPLVSDKAEREVWKRVLTLLNRETEVDL